MTRVYFDNAATTPLLPEVLDAMLPFLKEQYGNPSSQYSYGREARSAVEAARKTIAGLIGAQPGEIIFTSGGTEASNTVLWGAVRDLGVKRIITSTAEHHCVLHTVEALQKGGGVEAIYLPVDKEGNISLSDLEQHLAGSAEKKTLVSLMHANNETGTLLPLETVAQLCQQYGALFHSDTVQTFAHYRIDVSKVPVDFITASAHKFHGPKGAGFLYIRKGRGISSLLYGGGQERGHRAGTENVSGIAGMARAAELAYAGLDDMAARIGDLKQYCWQSIQENFPGAVVNGPPPARSLYTVLNVSFPPHPSGPLLLFALDMEGVCVSGGSACSSGASTGSHVLRAMGAEEDRINIRFSFSALNTREEVDFMIGKLKKVFAPA